MTYGSLTDMLSDTNRTGVNTLSGFGANVVGSGSDGDTYWNVFNIEGKSSVGADIVTYASLTDMLMDSNRLSVDTLSGFGRNVVGSGAFNIDSRVAVPEPPTLVVLMTGLFVLATVGSRRVRVELGG